MVYKIWLMGGLGNQLFQINYGYRLIGLGHDVIFLDNLVKKTRLTSMVLRWNIHPFFLNGVLDIDTHTEKNLLPIIFAKSCFFNRWSNYLNCSQLMNNIPKHIFSYFQCESVQEEVFFTNKIHPSLFNNSTISSHRIVVHMRFGDAPNLHKNMAYYKRALMLLKDSKFLVCTDDILFAENFLLTNYFSNYTISNGSLLDDFKHLVNAEVVVSAPSTFSFWAVKISEKISEVYVESDTYSALGSPTKNAKVHIL